MFEQDWSSDDVRKLAGVKSGKGRIRYGRKVRIGEGKGHGKRI